VFNDIHEGDMVQSRGYVCRKIEETKCVVFSRCQVIYSTSGTSRSRVFDVVDYSENVHGAQRGTYGDVRSALKFAK
jgi:hypothetical protein